MGKHATKRFDEPDETRSFDNGKLDVVHLSGSTAAQAIGPGDVYEILPPPRRLGRRER